MLRMNSSLINKFNFNGMQSLLIHTGKNINFSISKKTSIAYLKLRKHSYAVRLLDNARVDIELLVKNYGNDSYRKCHF